MANLIAMLIAIFLASPVHGAPKKNEGGWRWIDRRAGLGTDPDRLFVRGEYGYETPRWDGSSYGYLSPTLIHGGMAFNHKIANFLTHNVYAGRTQFFRIFPGGGLLPVSTPSTADFSLARLTSADRGESAGLWTMGYNVKFFWSTFKLLRWTYEGMFSFNSKVQWLDNSVPGNYFYDPASNAVVAKREWIQELSYFAAWRVNPEEQRASRVGIAGQIAWFQTNGAIQHRVGPALQTQEQNSGWEYFLHFPIKLEDPYARRGIGIFFMAAYKL